MEGSFGGALMALLYYLLFQCGGILAAHCFLRKEHFLIRLLFGSVLGSIMLEWLPLLFAFHFGFSIVSHILALSLVVVLAAAGVSYCLKTQIRPAVDFSPLRRHPFLAVIGIVFIFFFYLTLHGLRIEEGIVYSSQATYGDMSMHLGFITSITRQGTFPPEYSILPGVRLSYPFLSDSISSSLYLFGAPLQFAYVLPMLFAALQVFGGFYLFAYTWLKDKAKAALAFLFFFFNGGLGFVYFLGGEEGNFTRIFSAFYQTPTNLIDENIRWVNVVVDMMLPQRATLFGWAVLFPAMYLLYRAVFQNKKRYFIFAGVLFGCLPMIHTHSFLFAGILCMGWLLVSAIAQISHTEKPAIAIKMFLLAALLFMPVLRYFMYGSYQEKYNENSLALWIGVAGTAAVSFLLVILLVILIWEKRAAALLKSWGTLLGIVCVLALPQLLLWTFGQVGQGLEQGSFLKGNFNWANYDDPFLLFYLKNIGLTGLLTLGALLFTKKKTLYVAIPAFIAWFIAEFIQFQPNEYDNNKLLYPAFVLFCCIAAGFFVDTIRKIRIKPLKPVITACTLAVCMLSAVLTMGREAVASYEIFGTGATNLCNFIEENLPADATILTSTRHNNEVAALTGRNILCGSPSYLYFHGLDYRLNEFAVQDIYENTKHAKALISEYSVQYILISDFERHSYDLDELYFYNNYSCVYTDGNVFLYKI